MSDRPAPSPARTARALLGSISAAALVLALAACSDSATPDATATRAAADAPSLSRGGDADEAYPDFDDATVRYGRPQRVGNGLARTYVVLAKGRGHERAPLEIGIAMDETTMDGLAAPAPAAAMKMDGPMHGGLMPHGSMTQFLLDFPEHHGTPFRFMELDWNPAGHEPAGIYDIPHFDFHFYTISLAQRNAIDPARPEYNDEAANLPPVQYRFPFYVDAATAAGGIPAGLAAVPRMGLHWLDVRSPELQNALHNPSGYRPFTKTFIYGSWNGHVTFAEPMITRAYIMGKRAATDPTVRNEVTPVSVGTHYEIPGYYPSAYRISYDRRAKEYRIALTQLAWRK